MMSHHKHRPGTGIIIIIIIIRTIPSQTTGFFPDTNMYSLCMLKRQLVETEFDKTMKDSSQQKITMKKY